uniref:leucine-rich repeat-containing G-protein coupled receptor 5 isoform X1 n=1 Tax=Ciona intestinalis TaxID=7719 RepID=UPI0002B8EB0C|nr:leucine-rich repeat-containing G-protein coupled receptor 5 isoform X1 [Ciona intestinalis]|eukprot:XP_002123281.2 leucine-rich repeat-containing G-protein coupled receptor 5 isoform X1 [Ciona intestinalis]
MSVLNLLVLCWVVGSSPWVSSRTSGTAGVAMADSQPPQTRKSPPCPQACRCSRNTGFGYSVDCSSLDLNQVPSSVDELTTFLDLSVNNISVVASKAFSNLHLLQELRLVSDNIETLVPGAFDSLRALETLMLHNNRITNIPGRSFIDTPNLLDLNLDGNFISELHEDSLEGLQNLESLRLDDNRLSRVPTEALSKTPNLKALDLALNNIKVIHTGAFRHLTKLRMLNLRENKISRIEDGAFDGPVKCRILHLEHNQLTEYPRPVTGLTKLRELKLNDNKIQRLPDRAFSKQTNLEILMFHNNPLKSVGRWTFTNLRNLELLEIVGVEEQEHFPDLSGCNKLRELFVVGGRFTQIPDTLCGKKSVLQRLIVANNRLQNLGGISNCKMLDGLDISGNALKSLNENEMSNLTFLRTLDLSENKISSLAENVFGHSKLVKLNLAYNSFAYLPIRGLSQLRKLNVSGVKNMLYLPPIQFMNHLSQLEAAYPYHCCQVSNEWVRAHEYEWVGPDDEIIKQSSPAISCHPEPSALTPCDNLLPSVVVRVVLWLVLVFSSALNMTVVLSSIIRKCRNACRQAHRRQKTPEPVTTTSVTPEQHVMDKFVQSYDSTGSVSDTFELALCHLAFADFVAGVYIAILVAYDVTTRGNFAEHGAWWQQSLMCRTAGFFLVMGLQLSFFTVLIATVERYLATMFPLKPEKHISKAVLGLTLSAAWVISIATAIVTLVSGEEGFPLQERSRRVLPLYNGATCLPWSTHFKYVAVLVGGHVIACLGIVILCVLMYCARRKQSWLSAQKHTRRQISLTVACNVTLILPLALIGLLASAVTTYPSAAEPWVFSSESAYSNQEPAKLNVDLLLTMVMLLISLRFAINPLLYISFSESFRRDMRAAAGWLCCTIRRNRYHDYDTDDDIDDGFTEPTEFAFHDPNATRQLEASLPVFRHGKIAPDVIQSSGYETHVFGEEFANEPFYNMHSDGDLQRKITARRLETTRLVPVMLHAQAYDEDRLSPQLNHHEAKYSQCNSRDENITISQMSPERIAAEDNKLNYASAQVANKTYIAQGARPKYNTRLPPLIWRKYSPEDAANVDGKKLSQSCESSTSKDSGIQSEPDFGVAYSSGCSSLARSSASSHETGDSLDNTDTTYARGFLQVVGERTLPRNEAAHTVDAAHLKLNIAANDVRLEKVDLCELPKVGETVL